MKLTVKKLYGEGYTLEVDPKTYILDLKKQLIKLFNIQAREEITLLFMGRPMHDEMHVGSFPIKRGRRKLYLIIRKRDDLRAIAVKHFIRIGMNQAEAHRAGIEFMNTIREKFMSMSWDDVNRLAANILGVEPSNRIDSKLL